MATEETTLIHRPLQVTHTRRLPSAQQVGGKAYGIYWLTQHGFNAPPTWTLTVEAFDYVLRRAQLTSLALDIWREIADVGEGWEEIQATLERLEPKRAEIVAQLRQVPLDPQMARILHELPRHVYWAVRSSANVEDNAAYTFAGQFTSHLYVPTGQPLWEAIRDVWASLFAREALGYCAQRHTPLPKMAVILQPTGPITAEHRSGVVFSHSPIPAFPGVLIQATFGMGYTVVEGLGGDLYSVEGEKVTINPMRPPRIRITGPLGFTEESPTPPGLSLTEEEALRLARDVTAIAEQWGRPVDVEFTWRKGEKPLYVQVRSTTEQRG